MVPLDYCRLDDGVKKLAAGIQENTGHPARLNEGVRTMNTIKLHMYVHWTPIRAAELQSSLALLYNWSDMGYMLGKSEAFGVLCPCTGPSTSLVILMAIGDWNLFSWYWLLGKFLCDLWRLSPEESWGAEIECSEDKRWVRDMIMQKMMPCYMYKASVDH